MAMNKVVVLKNNGNRVHSNQFLEEAIQSFPSNVQPPSHIQVTYQGPMKVKQFLKLTEQEKQRLKEALLERWDRDKLVHDGYLTVTWLPDDGIMTTESIGFPLIKKLGLLKV